MTHVARKGWPPDECCSFPNWEPPGQIFSCYLLQIDRASPQLLYAHFRTQEVQAVVSSWPLFRSLTP